MSLKDGLLSAWSPESGCPPPEEWLRLATGEATPDERRSLEEHAARCPACAAEREMARLFAAPPDPEERVRRQEGVDRVVARLESLRLHETPRPLAFLVRRKPAAWIGSLAAVLALAVALGLFLRGGGAPPLPEPGSSTVRRGAELRPVQPIGEFQEMPRQFRWEVVEGARSYRVVLRAVDDNVLWQETVAAPSARLPDEVVRSLHPAVHYTWSVEALDERGARLAASEPVQFMVRPPGESPAPP